MALTRITKGVIKPNENYDTHNINSTGIVTAIGLDVNGNGDISGNLSVGGVLTYEDVTSIDSVGIITARGGIDCNGDIDVDGHTNLDNASIAGVTTIADDKKLYLGNDQDLELYYQTSGTPGAYVQTGSASGNLTIRNADAGQYVYIHGDHVHLRSTTGNEAYLQAQRNGAVKLWYDSSTYSTAKLQTTATGVTIDGTAVVGGLDISGDIDVDGQTSLDHTTFAGIVTFQSGSGLDLATHNRTAGMRIINNGNASSDGMYIGYGNANNGVTRLFGGGLTSNPTVINSTGVSIPNDLDVDGHTNLDNVSVAGVTTMSGNLTVSNTAPTVFLTDSNGNDFSLVVNSNVFRLRDETNGENRLTLNSSGHLHAMTPTISLGEATFGSSSITKVYSGTGGIKKNALMVLNPTASVAGRGAGVAVGALGTGEDYIGTLYGSRSSDGDNRGTTTLEGKDAIVIKTNASGTTKTVATFDASGNVIFGENTSANPFTYLRFAASQYGAADIRPTDEGSHKIGLAFYTDGTGTSGVNPTEKIRIDSSGRLQIGSSTLPNYNNFDGPGRLNINNNSADGTVDFSQGLVFTDNTNNSGTWTHAGIVCTGSTGYNGSLIFGTDGNSQSSSNITEKMRITHAGYVGINTTNPSTYLMISGPGNQRQDMLRLQHEGQRNFYIQGQWGSTDIGGSNGILQYTDGGGIAFRSGATGAAGMIVSQANKVGIHTNNPDVNLHANMAVTTNASVSWGANCGQIFRNEGSELAFGLQNTAPYPYYLQARTNASTARQLTLNPAGGAVAVGTINSFGRTFQVKGTIGVLSPSQTGVLDMGIDDAGNFEMGAYHSNGGSLTLKTAPAGLGNQTRLQINKDGQLTHTTNKSSEYTAKFVQAHADNPAWIEIDSPTDNNLRPAYIQLKNGGNNKWGIGQIYNPTAGQSFHITEGTHNQANSHFVIKSNNYVGINTNNPLSALHVRGAGGIRVDTLGNSIANQNDTYLSDGQGNAIISGTPWFTTGTFQWQGSYSGMGYYWIKVVKSLGDSAIGYIDYMAHGDSNYPRHCRGTIAIAKYASGSISCCHDQQTHEGAGNIQVKLCGDGTVWIRLHGYDWNSDFRFRLVYGESVTLNTDFTATGSSDNSYGRIDTRGGGHPVNASNEINPGANARYSVSANQFNPSGSNASYGNDDHRFFRINCINQLTKGSGSFRIDHPLAGMSTSHYLQHSFVEGPQADNIYRGKTTLVAGISTVNIDTASNMTDGTFVELNTDVQCFTTNETGWTPIKGSVSGNKLTIFAQDNSCTDTISWMVVGERQDDHIKNKADWTDSDGKVIVELPKQNVGFAGTEAPYDEFK